MSPATHSVVNSPKDKEKLVSFSNLTVESDTPKRGTLIGIVRPVWQKVTESECRLAWLHEMERNNLVVRNIESYARQVSECLRTEEMIIKEEERKVLLGLMKIKIKDERKHLEIMTRTREMARKWLKKIIGKSRMFIGIMKRLRGEMNGKRKHLKRKYDEKINHLKKEIKC